MSGLRNPVREIYRLSSESRLGPNKRDGDVNYLWNLEMALSLCSEILESWFYACVVSFRLSFEVQIVK